MWNYIKPSKWVRLNPAEPSLGARRQHLMTHVNTVMNIPSLRSSSEKHDMQIWPQCSPLAGTLQALKIPLLARWAPIPEEQ